MRAIIKGYNKNKIYRGHISNIKKRFYPKNDVNKLVSENLGLVHFVANKYTNLGLEYEDLVGEGNFGLFQAAKKYNPRLGYNFSTYAIWWIRQAITRAISDKSRAIKIPVYLTAKITDYKKVYSLLSNELGRKPTRAEIAKCLNIKEDKLDLLERISKDTVSLDNTISKDDEKTTIMDMLPDLNGDVDPYESSINSLLVSDTHKLLEKLNKKERFIITERFGINPENEKKTLEEIGSKLNVTRERVRQIEKKSLEKLKNDVMATKVKGYLK